MIVSAGGAPADRDLVQAHKALDAVAPVVRDGGTVVLVAACGDGAGNRELVDGLALGPPAAIEAELRRAFRVGLHTALALAEKTRRLRVLALTELPGELLAAARIERIASLDEAARVIAAVRRAAGRAGRSRPAGDRSCTRSFPAEDRGARVRSGPAGRGGTPEKDGSAGPAPARGAHSR